MNTLASVRAALGAPAVGNVDGEIHLVLPIANMGDVPLAGLEVRAIALGGAARTSPIAFPVVLGFVGVGGTVKVAARFAAAGMAVGARYLLSVTICHGAGKLVYSTHLNRYVRIPPPSAPAQATLRARIVSAQAAQCWRYTLFNDAAADSGLYVSSLALMVSAPVAIAGTPAGWRGETDGYSYVFWRAADYLPPYPNHLMPGDSLAGFALSSPRTMSQSSLAALSSWHHSVDAAGPIAADYVLTPHCA